MITKEIDYFDLEQIAESGQCFRWRKLDEYKYQIPAFDHVIEIAQSGSRFELSCTEQEFQNIWYNYFDLSLDYGAIIAKIDKNDIFLKSAADYGKGIRILNQDLWEIVLSFIISQNNNIPRIKKGIEAMCERYQRQPESLISSGIYTMPYMEDIEKYGGRESLGELGLGYRDAYIWNMCQHYQQSPEFFCELRQLDYEASMKYLMQFKGIGKKVANCICLFGLHHLDACPIDVWIKKVIDEEYGGNMPSWTSDRYAGIYQQYTFYYKRAR